MPIFTQGTDAHPDTRLAMQACLHRTPADLESMASAKPRVRLVKGAYAEPAEKALQSRSAVLEQYRMLTNWLFEHGVDPAFGTHDDDCIDYAKQARQVATHARRVANEAHPLLTTVALRHVDDLPVRKPTQGTSLKPLTCDRRRN